MRHLYFGAALASLVAGTGALTQAGPSVGSLPTPTNMSGPFNFGSGGGGVNSASTAQALGAAVGGSATTGTGGVDGALASGTGGRINALAPPTLGAGAGIGFNNTFLTRR